MSAAYIVDAVRTPRGGGKLGKGALTHLHPQHLGATVLKALLGQSGRPLDAVFDGLADFIDLHFQPGRLAGLIG